MKYLKLYEEQKAEVTLEDLLNKYSINRWTDVWIDCTHKNLTSLKGIEKMPNINWLNCSYNYLTSLKELKNTINNFDYLKCDNNLLTSLDGIEKHNLRVLECNNNPWKYPLSIELVEKYDIKYNDKCKYKFKSYKFQKEFLDKFPERVTDLKQFGYHKDLINNPNYSWIFDQESNGFFGLKN